MQCAPSMGVLFVCPPVFVPRFFTTVSSTSRPAGDWEISHPVLD
jgi:hypothetical protein